MFVNVHTISDTEIINMDNAKLTMDVSVLCGCIYIYIYTKNAEVALRTVWCFKFQTEINYVLGFLVSLVAMSSNTPK